MKKNLAIVAVLLLLLVLGVGPLFMGRFARARIDHGFDAVAGKVPYLRVVERTWSPGWFRSGLLVTLEYSPTGFDPQPASDEASPPQPLRVSVRSELLHGPFLGTSGIGRVRATSHFVFDEAIRARLVSLLGTDEPVHLVTRIGLLGGSTFTLAGEGRTVQLDKSGGGEGTLAWDDFRFSVDGGNDGRTFQVDGRQPRIEWSGREGEDRHVLLKDLRVGGEGSQVTQDLYDGNMEFRLGSILIADPKSGHVEIDDFHYGLASGSEGDYFSYAFRMGSGAVKSRALDAVGLQLRELHYDVTLRHLHTATLQKLLAAMRDASRNARTDPAEVQAAVLGPLKEHGLALLAHDPELLVDRLGVVTPEGEAVLRGSVRMVGMADADLSAGMLALLPRLSADLAFEAPQALLEKFPNGATLVGAGIDGGYFKRDGGRLTSHIEFHDGALKVNGKSPQVPPGFGGQAAPTPQSPVARPHVGA